MSGWVQPHLLDRNGHYYSRTDIELLFDRLPQPIDLDLDSEHRFLYWTDRGDPPRGNAGNRARIDVAPRSVKPEIVFTYLIEGIGLALDTRGNRMFMAHLGGSLALYWLIRLQPTQSFIRNLMRQSSGLKLGANCFALAAGTEDKKGGTSAFIQNRPPQFQR